MTVQLDRGPGLRGGRSFGRFLRDELKPKGPMLTWFNIISLPIMLLGFALIVLRFTDGLGAVTNLSQEHPWGLWVGFDVVTGVAFAGGAYVICFMVYILGMKKYKSILRVTVLNGLMAYIFYSGALLLDLGRPLNIVNPIIGNDFGVSSVMFLVAWHFLLYMTAMAFELSPAAAEWLGLKRAKKILAAMTLGAVVLGITLSSLHQSGLGALFLMAESKIHPLWYSEFIPILFLVSSVFAGLSMVIVEGSITRRAFADRHGPEDDNKHHKILVGLSRVCAGTMFVYLFMQLLTVIHGGELELLGTSWGMWFLTEMIVFTALPMVLFFRAARHGSARTIKLAAVLTMVGIVLNRLNISIIAFRWFEADRYIPSWMEIAVTAAIILTEIWVIRWVINRMPILESDIKKQEKKEAMS